MLSAITLISGAVAGWVSSLMFYPLESIEARQQLDARLRSRRTLDALRFVLKTEGLTGVYMGWEAGVCGVALNWSLYFATYETLMAMVPPPPDVLAQLAVGVATGIICCTLMNPFCVIKYRMVSGHAQQAADKGQSSIRFRTTVGQVVNEEGIWQLWSGVGPSYFGSLCGAIQFLLHGSFKRSEFLSHRDAIELPVLIFISGCVSSLIATVLTYPYQVVRGQVAVAKKAERAVNLWHLVLERYQQQGFRSFYIGLETNLIRQIPTSGCMLLVLELTSWFLSSVFLQINS